MAYPAGAGPARCTLSPAPDRVRQTPPAGTVDDTAGGRSTTGRAANSVLVGSADGRAPAFVASDWQGVPHDPEEREYERQAWRLGGER